MFRSPMLSRKIIHNLVLVLSLMVLLLPAPVAAAAVSTDSGTVTIGYTIPAGTNQTLTFNADTQGPGSELMFVFGGNPDALRIRRLVQTSGVDVEFAGATPVDATRFFFHNPLPTWSDEYVITVENTGDIDQHLQITARWK